MPFRRGRFEELPEAPRVPHRFAETRLPGARLVRLAEASHVAHVDAPDRFLPPVLDFLDEPAGAAAR